MLKAGIMTAMGVAIHSFPEGVAVFVGAIANLKLGLALAVAIALHNIPEGIAVSLPILYATKSRKKAVWYSFVAGIVEPIGAIIALLLLIPFLTPSVLFISFALVAGIMVFISFDELLPMSYCGERAHLSIFGVILGMLSSLSLKATLVWTGSILSVLLFAGFLASKLVSGEKTEFFLEVPPIRVPGLTNVLASR